MSAADETRDRPSQQDAHALHEPMVLPYEVLWTKRPAEPLICINGDAAAAAGGLPLKTRSVDGVAQLHARALRKGNDLVLMPRRIVLQTFPFERLGAEPLAATIDRNGNLEQVFRIVITVERTV